MILEPGGPPPGFFFHTKKRGGGAASTTPPLFAQPLLATGATLSKKSRGDYPNALAYVVNSKKKVTADPTAATRGGQGTHPEPKR